MSLDAAAACHAVPVALTVEYRDFLGQELTAWMEAVAPPPLPPCPQ